MEMIGILYTKDYYLQSVTIQAMWSPKTPLEATVLVRNQKKIDSQKHKHTDINKMIPFTHPTPGGLGHLEFLQFGNYRDEQF